MVDHQVLLRPLHFKMCVNFLLDWKSCNKKLHYLMRQTVCIMYIFFMWHVLQILMFHNWFHSVHLRKLPVSSSLYRLPTLLYNWDMPHWNCLTLVGDTHECKDKRILMAFMLTYETWLRKKGQNLEQLFTEALTKDNTRYSVTVNFMWTFYIQIAIGFERYI